MTRRPATEEAAVVLRIGEVAKLTGLTTRTLRYWEELGLIAPSDYRGQGERLYSPTDMARASRIKDLQDLLGFSLAEVRVVLDTEDVDVLDRVRSEYRQRGVTPARRRQLLDDAIEANDRLLDRLDDTLRRIGAFREERATKATRLREARRELDQGGSVGAPAGGSGPGARSRARTPERTRPPAAAGTTTRRSQS
jgi:DNA-binding transcriptional MerR regulator